MTNTELIDGLARIIDPRWSDIWRQDGGPDRKAFVSVSRAHLGMPSSVMIEFEGSPVRFAIFMSKIRQARGFRTLAVRSKCMRDGKPKARACVLIDRFLIENKHLTEDDVCSHD